MVVQKVDNGAFLRDAQIGNLIAENAQKGQQAERERDVQDAAIRKDAELKLQAKKEVFTDTQKHSTTDKLEQRAQIAEQLRTGQRGGAEKGIFGSYEQALGQHGDKQLQNNLQQFFLKKFQEDGKKALQGAEGFSAIVRDQQANAPGQAAQNARAQQATNRHTGPQANPLSNTNTLRMVHQKVMEQPQAARGLSAGLNTSYMRTQKQDRATTQKFLDFAARKSGQPEVVHKAGSLLGAVKFAGTSAAGMQSTMDAIHRAGDNADAMDKLDTGLKSLTSDAAFARTKSASAKGSLVSAAARTGGEESTVGALKDLVGSQGFQTQSASMQSAASHALGYAPRTDVAMAAAAMQQALGNPGFPRTTKGQTSFMRGFEGIVHKQGGAKAMDTEGLVKTSVRLSAPASPPVMEQISDDMTPEEQAQARSRNRAGSMRYWTALRNDLEDTKQKLETIKANPAKYSKEDVIALMRGRASIQAIQDPSSQENQAYNARNFEAMHALDAEVQDLLKYLKRATVRRGPTDRKLRETPRATNVAPTPYSKLSAAVGGTAGVKVSALGTSDQAKPSRPVGKSAQAMTAAPMDAGFGAGASPQAMALLDQAAATKTFNQDQLALLKQLFASAGVGGGAPAAAPTGELIGTPDANATSSGPARAQKAPGSHSAPFGVRYDEFGIPRATSSEVRTVQRPKAPVAANGARYVSDTTAMPTVEKMGAMSWGELKRAANILKNFGLNQQSWDARRTLGLPQAMYLPYVQLNPNQQDALRALNISSDDWDTGKVQKLLMGQNA